jgi:hypothetical protein
VFPTTSPSQFNPDEMRASINRLLALSPPAMYLTHYGQLNDVHQRGLDLLRRIDAVVEIALAESASGEARHQRIKQAMTAYLLNEIRAHGCLLPQDILLDIWESDLELNSQGLVIWLDSLV